MEKCGEAVLADALLWGARICWFLSDRLPTTPVGLSL